MTDAYPKVAKVETNLLRVLRESALHPAVIESVYNDWKQLLSRLPRRKNYRISKHDDGYYMVTYGLYERTAPFATVENADEWADWHFENSKRKFFEDLSDSLFRSITPTIISLAQSVQTNSSKAKNKRWAARMRIRERVRKVLMTNRDNIELDDEGFRSVEDQFMMVFQYCAEAKSSDRQRVYEIGEDHIVRKLYGPEQQMDTTANPRESV